MTAAARSATDGLRADPRAATSLMRGAAVLLVGALLALALWQYAMPPTFRSSWKLNPLGIEQFRAALGLPAFAVGDATYRWVFRALMGTAWAAYFLMVGAGVAGGRPSAALTGALGAGAAIALALFWPASLSTDVYAYVGYGRLPALYHLNPYLATQKTLIEIGDATSPFLRWRIGSPYGPLWTSVCVAVVAGLRGATLFAQVVVMKLVAAAAVIAMAWSGRALAERLERGRGELTLAAIALNPLFLIEGAGNGHNDLVMMALVLLGLAALAADRPARAALAVGLAAAIKFLPLLLVPWLALLAASSSRRWTRAAWVVVLGIGPVVLLFLPFWEGSATLSGLQERWARGHLERPGDIGALVAKNALPLLVYVGASLWLVRRPQIDRLVSAWVVAAGAVLMMAAGVWFPWYLAWPWAATLVRWDTRHAAAAYLLFCFAVVFTLRYSVLLGV